MVFASFEMSSVRSMYMKRLKGKETGHRTPAPPPMETNFEIAAFL